MTKPDTMFYLWLEDIAEFDLLSEMYQDAIRYNDLMGNHKKVQDYSRLLRDLCERMNHEMETEKTNTYVRNSLFLTPQQAN